MIAHAAADPMLIGKRATNPPTHQLAN